MNTQYLLTIKLPVHPEMQTVGRIIKHYQNFSAQNYRDDNGKEYQYLAFDCIESEPQIPLTANHGISIDRTSAETSGLLPMYREYGLKDAIVSFVSLPSVADGFKGVIDRVGVVDDSIVLLVGSPCAQDVISSNVS